MIPAAILLIVLIVGNALGWLWLLSWVRKRDRDAMQLVRDVETALAADRELAAKDRQNALKEREAELKRREEAVRTGDRARQG